MLEHRSQIEVRYAETDMMGVVYHGSYLPWLEVARTALLAAEGLPYRELEAQGYFLPVIEVGMRYLRPARYADVVTVHAVIREKPALRLRIDYELWRGAEKLATGHTEHVFIDKAGRPVRPPAAFAELVEKRFAYFSKK
ncbi:MAG: acyl-CoA thioesterase [Opitutaceae bacterium]|jgi:acyl-CoA thioester hydrolase|nr:acyl-CoA thioesterase [Opitutaceae bacterium]